MAAKPNTNPVRPCLEFSLMLSYSVILFFFAKNVNIINDDTNDIYILSNKKKNKIIECDNMRECSVILFMRMLFWLPLQLFLSNSFYEIN